MKFIRRLKQSSLGVTLLELMLVMTLVAAGAAIAVPKFQKAYWGREERRMTSALQTVADAIRLYQMDYAPDETLPWAITNHAATNIATRAVLLLLEQKGYLKRVELPIRGATAFSCFVFSLDTPRLYVLKIYPKSTNGFGGICDFAYPDYFWFSMDLQAGRAADKKGMGTSLVLTRANDPDSF